MKPSRIQGSLAPIRSTVEGTVAPGWEPGAFFTRAVEENQVSEVDALRAKIRTGDYDWRDVLRVYQLERGTDVETVRACPACNGVGRIATGEKCPVCSGKGSL